MDCIECGKPISESEAIENDGLCDECAYEGDGFSDYINDGWGVEDDW